MTGRATLHNFDEVERLDIRVGDTVLVEKAGEIIPDIVGVLKDKRPAAARREVGEFALRLLHDFDRQHRRPRGEIVDPHRF